MTTHAMQKTYPEIRPVRWAYRLIVFFMVLTGFGQMPIYKRYYINEVPGLGWLSDFYATHTLHYAGAALFLGLAAYMAVGWFASWKKEWSLTWSGWARVGLLGALAATGVLRVAKNMPNVVFSPNFTMVIDMSHLFLTMALLVALLVFAVLRPGWVKEKHEA
ncbi:MAG: FeS-binding protein [Deltaproteobacteria bacterium]|nr:FeS-binding protein [Deltaproteobacteria bacterium]